MSEGHPTVETNRNIQWNLGTFNIPTLVGLIGIAVMVFNAGQQTERQDARLDQIEESRAARLAVSDKQAELLASTTASVANVTYRLTVVEQGVLNTNARIDRQSDNMQDFRGDLAKVNTSIELLSQQIKILLPEKKAEIGTPSDLASR